MKFEVKTLDIKKIKANNGQIEGLPKNPRIIKDERFIKLKKSILDNPEMLELREILVTPFNNGYIVLGGNQRLKAMKDLGYKEAICKIIEDASIEQMRAYVIKDNGNFGDWTFDFSKDDWDINKLIDWGIEDFKIADMPKTKEASVEEPTPEQDTKSAMDDFYLAVYLNYIYAFRDTFVVTPNIINDPEYKCILNAQLKSSNASDSKPADFTI